MTWLYLRSRLRMAWTRAKPGSRKDWGFRIAIGFMVLVYAPVIGVGYWGISGLFHSIAAESGLQTLQQLLHLPVAAFAALLLLLVLNRVYPVLFEPADDELLRSLPITAQALTQARLTGLALVMSPVPLLLLPLFVFFGIEAAAPTHYYALAVLHVLLFALVVFAAGALATSLLVWTTPARGVRGMSKYGTTAILLPVSLATFMLLPRARQVSGAMEQVLEYADYVAVGPIAWVVQSLASAVAGTLAGVATSLALLLVSAIVMLGICVALTSRLASRDLAASAPASTQSAGSATWWAPGWLSGPSRALWRRELNAVGADAARTILMPMGMVLFFAIMSRVSGNFMTFPLILGLMVVGLLPGLTMAAVGQEGRAFWIVRTLPIPMWRVLLVKWMVRTSVGVIAIIIIACTGYVLANLGVAQAADGSNASNLLASLPTALAPALLPWAIVMTGFGILLSSVWGLATGARFPRFIPPRKGQYVSTGASLLGSFTPMAICGSLVGSLLPLQVEALRPVLWFLPLAVLAFWVFACLLYFAWAAWHLENLEDLEH